MHETGLLQHTYTSAPVYIAENIMELMGRELTPSLMRKLTKRAEEVGSELIDIGIDNMKRLCIIYVCITIFATFTLYYETIYYKVSTRWAPIKREQNKTNQSQAHQRAKEAHESRLKYQKRRLHLVNL